jgi:hypothetical protein
MLWEGRGKREKEGWWPGRERGVFFSTLTSSNWSRTAIFAANAKRDKDGNHSYEYCDNLAFLLC